MRVFLFPGQGSQYCGMGKDLFDAVPEFKAAETEIDRVLGYSAREVCLTGPETRLKDTRFTQPCLFIVNALYFYNAVRSGDQPDVVAGHSLGEYNALLAAGAFDLVTGVRLVAKRGELMSGAPGGAMAAVLRIPIERVQRILRDEPGLAMVDVANLNSAMQTVIAGSTETIRSAATAFESEGAKYMVLPVGAAFHSRLMAEVAGMFERFLEPFTFSAMKIPVLSNVTALPYPRECPGGLIKAFLAQQITSPVQWMGSMNYLRAKNGTTFTEVGPGRVLTRLCEQIAREAAA
ncbi:MAG: ACP S-malonyltransferase [Acidobacteriia bacterium]|nr:ACP S-malonyltransferase [Terriglobia bacterium]